MQVERSATSKKQLNHAKINEQGGRNHAHIMEVGKGFC